MEDELIILIIMIGISEGLQQNRITSGSYKQTEQQTYRQIKRELPEIHHHQRTKITGL
jgi:hypothetical protein